MNNKSYKIAFLLCVMCAYVQQKDIVLADGNKETAAAKSEQKTQPKTILPSNTSVLQVKKDHPDAIKIMQEQCDGRYEILDENHHKGQAKSQVEVGLSKPIGKEQKNAKTTPYIKYRCLHQ